MKLGQNKPLVLGGGLLFLLMLACGYFLWNFHKQNKSATSDLETKKTTLDGLVGKDIKGVITPSPTADNVAELDRQIQLASSYYTNYVDTLFKNLPPLRKAEPSDFQLEIETTVNSARNFAVTNEVQLGSPDGAVNPLLGGLPGGGLGDPNAATETEEVFFMDFDKYTKDGERPERDHIPRLARQLDILDDITRLLVQSGADRIVSVERDKFDLEAQEANAAGMLNFNPFGAPGAVEEEEKEIAYTNEVFKVLFEADEGKVFEVLSAMNNLPYPATVSQVHLKNQHASMIPFVEAANNALGLPGAGAAANLGLDGLPIPGAETQAKKDMADLILTAGRESIQVHAEIYVSTPPETPTEEDEDDPFGL